MHSDFSSTASVSFFPINLVLTLFNAKTTSESLSTHSVDLLLSSSLDCIGKWRGPHQMFFSLWTLTGQKTFHYRAVNIWNKLNNNFKLCIDINSFRNKLRGALLDKFKRKEWYFNYFNCYLVICIITLCIIMFLFFGFDAEKPFEEVVNMMYVCMYISSSHSHIMLCRLFGY